MATPIHSAVANLPREVQRDLASIKPSLLTHTVLHLNRALLYQEETITLLRATIASAQQRNEVLHEAIREALKELERVR